MRNQHGTRQSLADLEPPNKNSCWTAFSSRLRWVFIWCFCFFYPVYLRPNWGQVNSLNDFLSSACALHDPTEWRAILICFHKGKPSLLQPLVSLFCPSLQHTAFNTLVITRLKPNCSAQSNADNRLWLTDEQRDSLNSAHVIDSIYLF